MVQHHPIPFESSVLGQRDQSRSRTSGSGFGAEKVQAMWSRRDRLFAETCGSFCSVCRQTLCLLILTALLLGASGCADQKKQAKGLVQAAMRDRDADLHQDSVQKLNRALALDPQLSEAWYLRGLSHAALKRERESISDLTTAVRLNPRWAEAWLALGVAQRSSGETALAIKSFTEAIRQDSKMTAAWFDRASAFAELNEQTKAVEDLEATLRLDPEHPKALLRHAQLVMEERPDDACKNLSRLISLNRENSEAWLLRGLCWQSSGDSDRALADLNIACRMKSSDYRPWLERGRVLLQMGRAEDAVSDLSTAAQLGATVADCHYELARAFLAAGRTPAADANFQQALVLDPQHTAARLARAQLAAEANNHEAALRDLAKIDLSNGTNSSVTRRVMTQTARSLLATGQAESAMMAIASVLESAPEDRDALQIRAEVLQRLNRPDEAMADYTQLISLSASPQNFRLERARLYLNAVRYEEALIDLNEVLDQQPDHVDALALRGRVYEHQGEYTLAVTDLTAALKRQPENASVLRQRAAVFELLEEPIAAISDLQRAAELSGDETVIRETVSRFLAAGQLSSAIELLERMNVAGGEHLSGPLELLYCDLLLQDDRWNEALHRIQRLPFEQQESVDGLLLRTRIALAGNDHQGALTLLEDMVSESAPAEVHYLRGAALAKAGRPAEAEEELTRYLDLETDSAAAWVARAGAYASLQDWKKALLDAEAALERQPELAEARRIRGISHFQLGHFRDAIEDLDSTELRRQDTLELHWMRCRCFMELDQKFRAREELNSLIEIAPSHEQARLLRARLAEQHGEFDVALQDLESVMTRQPDNVDAAARHALLLHRRGHYEQAIDGFTKVLTLSPDNGEIYYRRGLAHHQLRNTEVALKDMDSALDILPEMADAWYVKGNILAGQDKADDALKSYDKAVEISPKHAAAWYNRGNLLFNLTRLEEAVDSWTRAIDHQPNLFRAYNNRAAALVKLNQEKDAVLNYERAIELSPGFARAWDNYAWLLATSDDPQIRDTTRAVFMAKKACDLTGYQDWNCISTLAAAYAEAGDLQQAVKWAQQSKEVAPAEQQDEIEKLVRTYETRRTARKSAATAVRASDAQRQ